jgi:hypothetical protein
MLFTAPQATIMLDGRLEDWQCAPIKAQTPFYPFNKPGLPGSGPITPGYEGAAEGSHCCGDELTMFDDRDGVKWDALDQSSAISFACERRRIARYRPRALSRRRTAKRCQPRCSLLAARCSLLAARCSLLAALRACEQAVARRGRARNLAGGCT